MEKVWMLSASECARRYQITRSTWYRMVNEGEAPEPIIDGYQKVWSINTLVEWEEDVLAANAPEKAEFSVASG